MLARHRRLFGFSALSSSDRASLLAHLLVEVEGCYGRWSVGGLAPLLHDLAARDVLRGASVDVGGVTGTAAGIAPDGRLVVETRDRPASSWRAAR